MSNANKSRQTEPPADTEQNDEVIGKALRYSALGFIAVAVLIGAGFAVSQWFTPEEEQREEAVVELPTKRETKRVELPKIPLTDITAVSGIDWVHTTGMEGEKLLPETMGGGVAVFDFDRDGDQDILFVGGKSWEWSKEPTANPRSLCLYANDGTAKFTDVTKQVGLDREIYGMAPIVGDFDNDGWQDLYVTAVGSNLLFKNQDGKKFVDITNESATAGNPKSWSTGATWFDYDNDGLLDLFVANYVVWQRELDLSLGFTIAGLDRAYGQPTAFSGTQNTLFRNLGGGKFADVTKEMGILVNNASTGVPEGKGLGVAAVDVDRDGWTDLIVANDTVRNFLYLNIDGETFEESGISMGLAFDRNGMSTGAMGIDVGHFRSDESLAVAIGNFANEQSSLYVADSPMAPFNDQAMASGIGPVSRLNLTFGMFFADLDLDGRLDIACSNGHLEGEINKVQPTQQYAQPPQFFWNAGTEGASEFTALSPEEIGTDAIKRMVGRGAAYGDLDGDGDVDIVLVGSGGPPRVLRNDQSLGHHWIKIAVQGANDSNRDAYGSTIELLADGVTQTRIVTPTRSYLSQCETTAIFGLGSTETVDSVTVTWPDQSKSVLDNPNINQLHLIQKGQAEPASN